MANHASAQKRYRQSEKRRTRNQHVKTTVRTSIKRVRAAVQRGDVKEAQSLLRTATKQIDHAVSHGVFHARTGSRYVSRLSASVAALQS